MRAGPRAGEERDRPERLLPLGRSRPESGAVHGEHDPSADDERDEGELRLRDEAPVPHRCVSEFGVPPAVELRATDPTQDPVHGVADHQREGDPPLGARPAVEPLDERERLDTIGGHRRRGYRSDHVRVRTGHRTNRTGPRSFTVVVLFGLSVPVGSRDLSAPGVTSTGNETRCPTRVHHSEKAEASRIGSRGARDGCCIGERDHEGLRPAKRDDEGGRARDADDRW